MGKFGWSLPPGVSMSDIDPPPTECEVCGRYAESCICSECSVCGAAGDPCCYGLVPLDGAYTSSHGLKRNKLQLIGSVKAKISKYQDLIVDEQQYLAWLEERPDTYVEGDNE